MPAARSVAHWLVKSEPGVYSIDDLKRDFATAWTGIRNYTARNFMRDAMHAGDPVLFYHSSAPKPEQVGIAGLAKVVKAAHADPTALDKKSEYHDPKATKDNPIWVAVDLGFVEKFPRLITLAELKTTRGLEKMALLQRGQRLSVQPVTAEEFAIILARAKEAPR